MPTIKSEIVKVAFSTIELCIIELFVSILSQVAERIGPYAVLPYTIYGQVELNLTYRFSNCNTSDNVLLLVLHMYCVVHVHLFTYRGSVYLFNSCHYVIQFLLLCYSIPTIISFKHDSPNLIRMSTLGVFHTIIRAEPAVV